MKPPTANIETAQGGTIVIRGTPEGVAALCDAIKSAAQNHADSTAVCHGPSILTVTDGALAHVSSATVKELSIHSHQGFKV